MDAQAAASARLCVETAHFAANRERAKAAAFARLCVETTMLKREINPSSAAAFARLCVETASALRGNWTEAKQPPSRGCVLKHKIPEEVLKQRLRRRLRAAVW